MDKPRLLYYLDDDNDDLYFFKLAAQSLGQNFSLFLSGQEMLQSLRVAEKKPDIIFLDLHMPVLNGEEILQILKNSDEFKQIPVVMISNAYPKKLVNYLVGVGADCLMKKPHGNFKGVLEEVLKMDLSKSDVSA